jgi:hypothetical protein
MPGHTARERARAALRYDPELLYGAGTLAVDCRHEPYPLPGAATRASGTPPTTPTVSYFAALGPVVGRLEALIAAAVPAHRFPDRHAATRPSGWAMRPDRAARTYWKASPVRADCPCRRDGEAAGDDPATASDRHDQLGLARREVGAAVRRRRVAGRSARVAGPGRRALTRCGARRRHPYPSLPRRRWRAGSDLRGGRLSRRPRCLAATLTVAA